MLNMLAAYELPALASPLRHHVLVEVMRRAYRDRALYLGDPDFVAMPLARLLSPDYAAGQVTSLRLDRATPSAALALAVPGLPVGDDTSHFSVLDGEGNAVATTQSINFSFGSGFMAPGTGVWLNNEMDDFSIKPGTPNGYELIGAEANAIAPGKRMLSSMTPSLISDADGLGILGTPGGSRIISMVLIGALAWFEGAPAAEIAARPRLHHQYFPDEVVYEPEALSPAEVDALAALGHALAPATRRYGNMHVIRWNYATGAVEAAADPRGIGAPAYLPASRPARAAAVR
jgi:gamma-glutamyltranspeptidase/glutathione hydrolase